MTTSAYYSGPKILQRLREGPLGVHIDIYAAKLLEEGHCRQSAWRSLRVVCDFSHWLARKRLDLQDMNEETVKQYEQFRLRCRCPFVSDHSALQRLLALLREKDIIAPRPPIVLGALDQIAEDFYQHLSLKRGLARVTITRHIPIVRQFLHERCAAGAAQIARLTATDLVRFVERHAGDHSPRSAQSMCWTLRAFTRYLQYQGYVAIDLASSVPSIKQWRLTSLLQAGVDSSIIALWLGHESVETTQVYLHAHLAIKEAALAKIKPLKGKKPDRYHPGDQLLTFLNAL